MPPCRDTPGLLCLSPGVARNHRRYLASQGNRYDTRQPYSGVHYTIFSVRMKQETRNLRHEKPGFTRFSMMPMPLRLSRWVLPSRDAFLRLVYPPVCPGCGSFMAEATAPLCHRCLHTLERVDTKQLDALLARLPEAHETLSGAFALWRFDAGGTVQRIQHRLKYGNRPLLGCALGRLLGTNIKVPSASLHLVLPIPLHRTRLYERGYNQSAMLARGIGEALGVPMRQGVLERRRATRSQTNLSRRQRWHNVAEAFSVTHPREVAHRHLLLVDDVLTTGATLAAAAATLRQAGAASVYAATIAMAS